MKRPNGSKVIFIVIIGIILVIFVYFLLFISTNSVVKYVDSVFKGAVPRDELPACLESYDITENRPHLSEVDVTITRRFVLHNFSEGYMWVKYSVEGHTSDGSPGYGEVASARWTIQRAGNGWEIVDVREFDKTDTLWYKIWKIWKLFDK